MRKKSRNVTRGKFCLAVSEREGQRRLGAGRVAIVGCGATGSALASLLARAGVGVLRIIDRDYVEASNLQRQSLFEEKDAAESLPKAIAAARKIALFNSAIVVEARVEDVVPQNIEALLEGMDLILDGADNFETRYLLNDRLCGAAWQAVDLCGCGGQLRRDIECIAGVQDILSRVHFSLTPAARHG